MVEPTAAEALPSPRIATRRTSPLPPLPRGRRRSPNALADLVLVLATRESLWRPVVRFQVHERWFTRFAGGEGWEAWLHTWLPGQGIGEHDHATSIGAFTVLHGRLTETEYPDQRVPGEPASSSLPGTASPICTREVAAGEHRTFGLGYRHSVANTGTERAVSLHVYAPGLVSVPRG